MFFMIFWQSGVLSVKKHIHESKKAMLLQDCLMLHIIKC